MARDPLRPINRQKTIKVLERAVRDPSYPPEPKSRARRALRLLKKVEARWPQHDAILPSGWGAPPPGRSTALYGPPGRASINGG